MHSNKLNHYLSTLKIFSIIALINGTAFYAQNDTIKAVKDITSFFDSEGKIYHYYQEDIINSEDAKSSLEFYQKYLDVLKYELKEDNTPESHNLLLRLFLLPTFESPICYTLYQKKDSYFLQTKIGNGMGGYNPKGLKNKKTRKLKLEEWNYFDELIGLKSLDTLPYLTKQFMLDGTSYKFEIFNSDTTKMYYTNILNEALEDAEAWLYYMGKIKQKRMVYFFDSSRIHFFDKSNKLIDLKTVRNEIINRYNEVFGDSLYHRDLTILKETYIKINRSNKITGVRHIPYALPFRNFSERFEEFEENWIDRKIRKKILSSLKNLKITPINLKKTTWIPVYAKIDEQTGKLIEKEKE